MLQWVNVALRATMELMIVAGLGYWGYSIGGSEVTKILLAIAVPLVGFGVWSVVDFRRAGRAAEPLRLTEELVISFAAAAAWFAADQTAVAWVLVCISLAHHALVYVLGNTLLKDTAKSHH